MVFLCGARDFHAMDWYRSAKALAPEAEILIVTDLISAEGYKKLITTEDVIFPLIIIDKYLFNRQSKLGHLWRNIVKLLVFPFQTFLLRRFSKAHPEKIYYAHSMYYIILAWASGVTFIATPQGSDILIKPYRSLLYRYFAVISIQSAKAVSVDSNKMKTKIKELSGVDAYVIQNGIDVEAINMLQTMNGDIRFDRSRILSVRGITELYRIEDILVARQHSSNENNVPITFIYPFSDNEYYNRIRALQNSEDIDLGRVERLDMYKIMLAAKLVVSIPFSDSSPRSVYEAIFCGCAVAITHHPYYDTLPDCMKSRVVLVDLNDNSWFSYAIQKAQSICNRAYVPSDEALFLFDQKKSFNLVLNLL
jgi:hypothetical protein